MGSNKKSRANKRKRIGYDSVAPEMCGNCKHFQSGRTINKNYFPPRCQKHLLQVERHAICNHWEDDVSKNNNTGL